MIISTIKVGDHSLFSKSEDGKEYDNKFPAAIMLEEHKCEYVIKKLIKIAQQNWPSKRAPSNAKWLENAYNFFFFCLNQRNV